mmetsp:Transcript_3950/g.7874  ORF Transcript_3950/g.7874 Transcript_3950/m.7874 type:complete len:216 (-) Transcript_3950:39-686(-)
MRIVFTRGTINGTSVQLKPFGSRVLSHHKWQMIHPITLSKNTMKEGYQTGMCQHFLKDATIGAPFQNSTQVFASRTRSVHVSTLDSIPQGVIGSFNHFGRMLVDGSVGFLDFFWCKDTSNHQKAIQIKEISFIFGHFERIFVILFGSCRHDTSTETKRTTRTPTRREGVRLQSQGSSTKNKNHPSSIGNNHAVFQVDPTLVQFFVEIPCSCRFFV